VWPLLLALLIGIALLSLLRAPRPLAWGVAALLAFGALCTLEFRARRYGYYFHFKTLAFIGPIAVCCAAVGLGRLRVVGAVALFLWIAGATTLANNELGITYNQLSASMLGLRGFTAGLPPRASIRLDVPPDGRQLWVAYMLAPARLCSEEPLVNTSYPHVPVSRKADYIVVDDLPGGQIVRTAPPFDAIGPPLRRNAQFALYRQNPSVPGPDACSPLRVQTVTSIGGG
jgi:hypothetical protein